MNYHPILTGLALVSLASGQTIPNYPVANLALGQAVFNTNSPATTPSGLNNPSAVVVDAVSLKVFVADENNNRVLRYASATALASGAAAEVVLGQANFVSSVALAPPTAQSMIAPSGLFLDPQGRLWVADNGNNRVLMFAGAVAAVSGAAADRVYGQATFTTSSSATTDAAMDNPVGVWIDGADRLWVADSSNNRVLRFDTITSKLSGAAANGVLGQPNFTTSSSGNGAAQLYEANALAISPTGALFVASTGNNRVVRFDNAAALTNGANANVIFGQPDFTTTSSSATAVKMTSPRGLTVTSSDALWVCDTLTNRVIRFDQASTRSSGAAANGVVGQPDLVSGGFTSLNAQGLNAPSRSPFVDSTGSLWVPDQSNRRVLRYAPLPVVVPDVTAPLLTQTGKTPKSTASKSIKIKGRASDASGIRNVRYRVNKSPFTLASGKTSWSFKANLKKGKNTITIIATDNNGNPSLSRVIKITRN
jgi:sugar lactone lactonase YvrE